MPIHYALHKNNLTEEPNVYSAQVRCTMSAGTEQIVERMLKQGSTITRADTLAVLENAVDAIESMLLEGQRVNFGGLIDLFPRIRGKFTSLDDAFTHDRHVCDVAAACGARVRKSFRTMATPEKEIASPPVAQLTGYRDVYSGTTDSEITPAFAAVISGKNLQFDPDKADEGIYFVPTGAGQAVKAGNNLVLKNAPKQIMFTNPESIQPGTEYHLFVRNRPGGVQQLREGKLNAVLMVP